MTPIYAKAGDTFFTRSNTLLGRLIRWGETDKGEAKDTWANHTGVVVEDGWIGNPDAAGTGAHFVEAVVVEALWKTRRGPLELNGIDVRVFRPVPAYDAVELSRFRAEADSYVGDTYGWWKLLVQLGDRALFRGRKVLTQLLYVKGRPICSFLAGFVNQMAQGGTRIGARVAAHQAAGGNGSSVYAFGIPPQACDPDSMMDYCLKNPREWEEVI